VETRVTRPRAARPCRSPGAGWGVAAALAILAATAGCDDDNPATPEDGPFAPSEPRLLTTSSPTKDEDPSVLRAQDGRLLVAWFSDRGGNADLYLSGTTNGADWSPPTRLTTDPGGDFYPNLFQDSQGTFHLVWFRWTALYVGHIWHNTSPDGLAWDEAGAEPVTTDADVDDWVPTITQAANGTLLVFFVSAARDASNPTNEIYVAAKRPGQASWDAAVPLTALNSATEHDQLPFAARTGDEITLVWVRSPPAYPTPWTGADSDLCLATSPDGSTWSAPVRLTNDAGDVVHVFPSIYATHDGDFSLLWLSTRLGSPFVFEVPLSLAASYPQGIVANPLLPAGYSHRVVATSRPGVYLGAWVQGPEGAQDIWVRFLEG
jgi:hypothetical protein